MYMDDDANMQTPLDDIIRPNDKFVVAEVIKFCCMSYYIFLC